LKYLKRNLIIVYAIAASAALVPCNHWPAVPDSLAATGGSPAREQVQIERIAPQNGSGQGYKLVYYVNLPVDTYWKFKTDFDNKFVNENKYIRDHRLISQHGNMAITENKYVHGPDVYFRWRTTVSRTGFKLTFVLLNPEQCQQRYHHGSIEVRPEGQRSRVTQVAYFDFWGASFWAHYPWKGGMKHMLAYTARWEQSMALRLKYRYDENTNQAH
jgi:hypothetical protein